MKWSLKMYGEVEDSASLREAVESLATQFSEDETFRGVLHVEGENRDLFGLAAPQPEEPEDDPV